MPCCCQTNLQATFVLGIIGLVVNILSLYPFLNWGAIMGIVASICFIVGAKAPNSSAILVGMICACIECVAMIILSIYALVVATSNPGRVNSYLSNAGMSHQYAIYKDVKVHPGTVGALVIAGVVLTVGAVIFQIWVIIVANKARKEIN